MSFRKILILILVVGIIFFAALSFSKKPASLETESAKPEEVSGKEIIYTDAQSNQQLKVFYYNDNRIALYKDESGEVVLTATTTGSGAGYENFEQGLLLWNKDTEVSLYLNDSLIFLGNSSQ